MIELKAILLFFRDGDSIITRTEALKESIFNVMTSGPQLLTTLLIIKPRAVKRHLSKIIKKIVQEGFKIVAMRLQTLTDDNIQYLLKNDQVEVSFHYLFIFKEKKSEVK